MSTTVDPTVLAQLMAAVKMSPTLPTRLAIVTVAVVQQNLPSQEMSILTALQMKQKQIRPNK